MTNKNKSQFLGMPFGTAAHRLRKSILFNLVQRLGLDWCFGCNGKINTVSELSIEHKQPWENISVDLFWDLDNIAFSHLKCNLPHKQNGGKHREIKGGKFKCCECQEWKTVESFDAKKHGCGRSSICKVCKKLKDTRRNHDKSLNYGILVNEVSHLSV